ncbi:hypothetical protein [Mycobacterium sp. PSTR-4-N]|uniref:hypothetical protein n=1 Tax=Mycobacterium sp. PSTR-4-N TaxID=2917745 RepID=UPI001F151E43|nr:hypothetical protein [Mycobacterium sp. PSTR-4-N]MCG7594575.1 hypothetical protein [Mycobacterium sp. PSTR-4-N]
MTLTEDAASTDDVPTGRSADAARIVAALLAGLPGADTADTVDTDAVAAALPERASGSGLREIVRRAVLSADDTGLLANTALLAELGSGRYRAIPTERMYR